MKPLTFAATVLGTSGRPGGCLVTIEQAGYKALAAIFNAMRDPGLSDTAAQVTSFACNPQGVKWRWYSVLPADAEVSIAYDYSDMEIPEIFGVGEEWDRNAYEGELIVSRFGMYIKTWEEGVNDSDFESDEICFSLDHGTSFRSKVTNPNTRITPELVFESLKAVMEGNQNLEAVYQRHKERDRS